MNCHSNVNLTLFVFVMFITLSNAGINSYGMTETFIPLILVKIKYGQNKNHCKEGKGSPLQMKLTYMS